MRACLTLFAIRCPHTAIYVSIHVSAFCYICVRILLYMRQHMCPHTAIYVSAYCYICVRTPMYMCPHTGISRVGVCKRLTQSILLYMCLHADIYVSAYRYQPQVAQKAGNTVALGDHLDPGLFTIEACPPSLNSALMQP
jgi:hypothetical protein